LMVVFLFCCSLHATSSAVRYSLSLHDALPMSCPYRPAVRLHSLRFHQGFRPEFHCPRQHRHWRLRAHVSCLQSALRGAVPLRSEDRKSTRLNSSHVKISYAVFCSKKKKWHSVL